MRMRIVSLATLLLLPLGSATSQEDRRGGPGDAFADRVDVHVVNLEVYVQDGRQQRVRNLTLDDFLLEVDGQPVGISNFYALSRGVERGSARPTSPDPSLPQPQLEEQGLHFVVYIDNFNLRTSTRNRNLGWVRTFLKEGLRAGVDEVMLVTYERSMRVRHPFTTAPEGMAAAFAEIETLAASGAHTDGDRAALLDSIFHDDPEVAFSDLRERAKSYAESVYNDMSFTLRALEDLVESLAGLPGRKAVLYVSDGLPMRPAEDVFHALDHRYRDLEEAGGILLEAVGYDMSSDFRKLTNQANANRVTFYTLDASGLRTYSADSPEGAVYVDQVHLSNLQGSLRHLAQETGGLAILNTNDPRPGLAQVGQDFRTYYSLGFSVGEPAAGHYHTVRVTLSEPDLEVRHRGGYRDKALATRMADGTLAAAHYGYESNPLSIRIEAGAESLAEENRYLVPVGIYIPIAGLSYLEADGYHRGRIRLFITARDSDGGLAPVQDVPVPIDIPAADFAGAQGQDYRYELNLLMRQGRQVLSVGVYDEVGAVAAFVSRGLQVGEPRP